MPERFHGTTTMGDSQRICRLQRQASNPQHFSKHQSAVDNFYSLLMLLERLILGLPSLASVTARIQAFSWSSFSCVVSSCMFDCLLHESLQTWLFWRSH